MTDAYLRLLDALQANGRNVIQRGDDRASATCPSHDDGRASLSVGPRSDGKGAVVYCHAGCDYRDVLAAVGLTESDLFDDAGMRDAYSDRNTYAYPGGRTVHRRPGKKFWQDGDKTDRSLFGADHITDDTATVYVAEGEKDVLAALSVGAVAVCSPMGAGKAHKADWSPLKGKPTILVADADTAGRAHMRQVADILDGAAASVDIVQSPFGKDLADHIAAGRTLDELVPVDVYPDDPPPPDEPPPPRDDEPVWTFVDGATFILDQPATIPALWGSGTEVLWAEGESLMIAGPMSLGKTTLAVLLMRAQLGLGDGVVLGLPVPPCDGNVLYLGMDRPPQIARAMRRLFTEADRDVLAQRLRVWRGPPPADIAKQPSLLTGLAQDADAKTVYLDSVKDATVRLSDDEVGAGYNKARQQLLAAGVQLCEQHHTVKRNAAGGPPTTVPDIYGSAWITNGTGSIVMLTGEPGDPIVGLRHVRAPADQVGPFKLLHDPDAGTLAINHSVDLIELVAAAGFVGLTAKGAAAQLFDVVEATSGQVEKARRRLMKLTAEGLLAHIEGERGRGGKPSSWFLPARTDVL